MATNTTTSTSITPKLGAFLILVLTANALLALYLGYEVYEVKKMMSQGEQPEIVEPLSEGSKNIRKRDVEAKVEMNFDAKVEMDFYTLSGEDDDCNTGLCKKETTTPKTEEVRVNSEFTEFVKSLWNKKMISFDPGKGPLSKPAIHLVRNYGTKSDLCDENATGYQHSAIKHLRVVTEDRNKMLEFNRITGRVKIKVPGYYYVYSQVEYQLKKAHHDKLKEKIKSGQIKQYDLRDGHVVCKGKTVLLESYFSPFDVKTSTFIRTTLTDFNGGIFLFEKDDTIWIKNLGPISVNDNQIYFGAFYFDFPPQIEAEKAKSSDSQTNRLQLL